MALPQYLDFDTPRQAHLIVASKCNLKQAKSGSQYLLPRHAIYFTGIFEVPARSLLMLNFWMTGYSEGIDSIKTFFSLKFANPDYPSQAPQRKFYPCQAHPYSPTLIMGNERLEFYDVGPTDTRSNLQLWSEVEPPREDPSFQEICFSPKL